MRTLLKIFSTLSSSKKKRSGSEAGQHNIENHYATHLQMLDVRAAHMIASALELVIDYDTPHSC